MVHLCVLEIVRVGAQSLTVPRHATTMSRRPSAASPSSVATATYPIQLVYVDPAGSSVAGCTNMALVTELDDSDSDSDHGRMVA